MFLFRAPTDELRRGRVPLVVDGARFGTWIGGSFWKGFSRGLDLASSMGGRTLTRSCSGEGERSCVIAIPTDEFSGAGILLMLLVFCSGVMFWPRGGNGPVGRRSIDLRIRSSTFSFLLFTSSTGGKMCKIGPAAIVLLLYCRD